LDLGRVSAARRPRIKPHDPVRPQRGSQRWARAGERERVFLALEREVVRRDVV
jgi:hypothetical protein